MAKEKWKKYKFHNDYLISSWGRIFSIPAKKMLRPYIHKSRTNNYLRVKFKDNKKLMVHWLVAYHFCKFEGDVRKFQVNHKDRNTLNCNANNLEWVSDSDNKIHRHETDVITFGGKTYKARNEART